MYDILTESEEFPKDVMLLRICCSHFFKMICNDINKIVDDKMMRHFFKSKLAVLFEINNLRDIFSFLKHLSILLTNEKENKSVLIAKSFLDSRSVTKKKDHLEMDENYSILNDGIIPLSNEDDGTLYKKKQLFQNISRNT